MRDFINDFMMAFIFFGAFVAYGVACFELGQHDGKDYAIAHASNVTPAPVDINKQCSAWLFETNMKEAKKKICGGKK